MTRPPHDTYSNLYVSGGYNTFTRDMTDSLASIWSRNSPSGENVAFSGGYGQFPDSSQGQFAATPASGQYAANMSGHFPPASDYSAYAQQYGYGSQYTQWDDGLGRGGYSYLGSGVQGNAAGPSRPGSESERFLDSHHGVDNVRLAGKTLGKATMEANNQAKSKKMSWANVASQPAKQQIATVKSKRPGVLPPPSIIPSKPPVQLASSPSEKVSIPPPMEMPMPFTAKELPKREQQMPPPSNYVNNNNSNQASDQKQGVNSASQEFQSTRPMPRAQAPSADGASRNSGSYQAAAHPVLDNLHGSTEYNPKIFDLDPKNAKFFVIKSFSEDDIHRSIKYQIWCSTDFGNKRLDDAFRKMNSKGPIYLLFSVNGSGHFCGMAEMLSPVDYSSSSSVWVQDKFKGQFKVKWIYVKDVPNHQLRHIRLENNENKPVTNSRDTQEVPPDKGVQVLKIIHAYNHSTSIFDDFIHYEKRQQEEQNCKKANGNGYQGMKGEYRGSGPHGHRDDHYHQGSGDHQRGGTRPYRGGGHYSSRSGPPPPRN